MYVMYIVYKVYTQYNVKYILLFTLEYLLNICVWCCDLTSPNRRLLSGCEVYLSMFHVL